MHFLHEQDVPCWDQVKRRFLDDGVRAINEHGGFGTWSWEVSKNPAEIKNLLAKHKQPALPASATL